MSKEEAERIQMSETSYRAGSFNYTNMQVMNGAAYEVCTARTCEYTLPIQMLVDVCLSLCKVMMTCKVYDINRGRADNNINKTWNINNVH